MRIALNVLGGVIVSLLALPFLAAMLVNGYYVTVTSGSMVPSYRPGDVLLVSRDVQASTLRAGDIVVIDPAHAVQHYSGSSLRLGPYVHRIVRVEQDGRFETKGDANTVPDPGTVAASTLSGRPTGIRLTGIGAFLFTMSQNVFTRCGLLAGGLVVFVLACRVGQRRRGAAAASARIDTAAADTAAVGIPATV